MRTLAGFSALSGLLAAQLRPGVMTNAFLDEAGWRRALENGLSCREAPGALLLLRRRAGFSQLYFYVQPGAARLPLDGAGTVVAELPLPPRRESAMALPLRLLAEAGLRPALERLRLSRPADCLVPPTDERVRPASPDDAPEALALLRAAFDPLTGCLPDPDELLADIRAGLVLCAGPAGAPEALLRFAPAGRGSEIRHLATAARCRGQGLGTALVQALPQQRGTSAARVWTGADNAAALAVYTACDYARDGWRAAVLKGEAL